jgi:hypothetical protein
MSDGRDQPAARLTWGKRLRLLLFPTLLGPAQLFLFGPWTTYARNENEFAVGFWSLAPSWLGPTAALVALLALAGIWLPRRWLQRYVAALFALGVLLWVQGNLLVFDYGPLYGAPPDFERAAWRSPLELGLWAAVLGLAIVFARFLGAVAPSASQALLALQLVLFVAPAAGLLQQNEGDAPRGRRWSEAPARIFELSRGRNVIHLVLDGFASEIFAEAVDRERAAFDRDLSGFVFFADHLGAFRSTRASMPAMLTGIAYRNEVPFDDFRARALRQRSVFRVLAEHGYRVHSISFHPGEHPPTSFQGRVTRYDIPTPYVDRATYERFAAAQVLDLTLFRHAPGSLKRRVYNDDRWLLQQRSGLASRHVRQSNHLAFFDDLTGRLAVASERPVYLFVHVLPPHPPVVFDSSCRVLEPQPGTRSAYAGQAACVLAHVRSFLERLREIGAYDRSAILLTADHGWLLDRPDHPLEGILTPAGRLDRVASDAMPLLAVKAPGASGPLRTSYAPTSLTDLPATIASLAGAPSQALPGLPVLEIDDRAPRSRTFTFHSWKNADWHRRFFDALLVFDVNGRVLDREAWRFQRAIPDPTEDPDAVRGRLERGLSGADNVDGELVRWGARYAVTYAPTDARTLHVTARKDAATTARAAVTVRLDGRTIGRLDLDDDGWHTLSHPLERKEVPSPFCVELLSERAGHGKGKRAERIQYRPPFWTR